MKYKITHTTTYLYQSPVRVCHNLVLLTPREEPLLRCHSHRLQILPNPQITNHRIDFFGNHLRAFSIEEAHRQLKVTATSRVQVTPRGKVDVNQSPPWEEFAQALARQEEANWLEASVYLFDSRRIVRGNEFKEYARDAFSPRKPVLAAALSLTEKIYREFKYDPSATAVHTKPIDAFRLRRGVCQDFAHIAISCLRSMGIPTRYVSGYLRTIPPPGKPRLVGVDQSHAWISVYCGETLKWIDIDPTNNCICQTDHVPIAWGRDYHDVVPLRGVFLGGGSHTLNVSVDVLPIQDSAVPAAD